jgi:hypothetical protein
VEAAIAVLIDEFVNIAVLELPKLLNVVGKPLGELKTVVAGEDREKEELADVDNS